MGRASAKHKRMHLEKKEAVVATGRVLMEFSAYLNEVQKIRAHRRHIHWIGIGSYSGFSYSLLELDSILNICKTRGNTPFPGEMKMDNIRAHVCRTNNSINSFPYLLYFSSSRMNDMYTYVWYASSLNPVVFHNRNTRIKPIWTNIVAFNKIIPTIGSFILWNIIVDRMRVRMGSV